MINELKKIIKNALSKGFFHLLSANLFLQLVGFGMQIFLTRILSVEDIGRLKILQSFVAIITIIASLGINTAILKLCSEDIENSDREKIFINAVKINLISGISTIFIVIILSFNNLISTDALISRAFMFYSLMIPLMVFNELGMSYLQAQKKIKIMSKVQILIKITTIILVISMSYFLGFYGYVFGMVITAVIGFLVFLLFFRDELCKFKKIKMEEKYAKKIFNIGKYGFAANAIGRIIATIDIIMLNYLIKDAGSIGYYGVSQIIITGLRVIPLTLNQIMVPYISYASNNKSDLKKLYKNYQRSMSGLMLLVCIGSYFIIPFFIPIVFGNQYVLSIPYFKILLLGLLFSSISSPKGITLWGIGKINYNFYSSTIVAVFNLILNFILISKFGIIGAAYATTTAYFLNIFTCSYFFKKGGLDDMKIKSLSFLNPISLPRKLNGRYKKYILFKSFKKIDALEVDIYNQRILTPKLMEIGNDVFMGEDIYISAEVSIGDRVMFGPQCTIMGGDHIFERMGRYPRYIKPLNRENSKKIIIEEDVWIGTRSIILKGVHIGKGAVIGAGSVVVKNIPSYVVAVGNPCVPVKKIFSDEELNQHLIQCGYQNDEIEEIISKRNLDLSNK